MNTCKIRPIQEDDIPEMAILYEQFWNDKSDIASMKMSLQKIVNNPDYTILNAFINDTLVGSVLGIVCHELYGTGKPFFVIEDFIVDTKYKRQGIGKKLLREIELVAQEKHCVHIILVTDTERTDAQALYENSGYTKKKGYKKKIVSQLH